MKQILRASLVMFMCLTVITGVLYPLLVTGIGNSLFPAQVAGSLIKKQGVVIGSALIGQDFHSPHYFWGRPSATSPYPNNAAASAGSNLGPLNPALADAVVARYQQYQTADSAPQSVPVELLTASASGLDPDISPAAALYQVARVAAARHMDSAQLKTLIANNTIPRQFGVLGEPRLNVLGLNLALDEMASRQK
ncbi:MAG: potassium-transporting ATPase subunit KdpC [Methylophilus sp.]|uniref:potassium-transporting ATPase subunit KdpC n=3 Tax=Methylophilus sp. TaxID=29541 RepID=UPI00403710ED